MALEFGFYDSYNHDRVYNAENMNDIFEGVITDGVYAGVGEMFVVKPSIGLQVTVGTGRAWFKMTWNKNRTMAPVNLDTPDPVYDRIDTVCIRVRKNILYRVNDFFVYKGNILVNPQPPILQNTDDTFYLPLANVTVRANAEDILPSDIEMLVGRDPCPFVTSILQQTDITDLFAQWQDQFERWWNGVKDILNQVESGDLGAIFSMIAEKVDKSDKATEEDIALNSDIKWMTPKMTKGMIEEVVGEGLDDIRESLQNGVVNSFKGRKGDVTPQNGDYTAAQVGALPTSGGTVSGNLTVTGSTSLSGLTASSITNSGSLSVTGASTMNGLVTMKNNLRLQGSSTYGSVLNFGDSDYVHISEPSDDAMEIKANSINFVLNGSAGSANTNFKINGTNPFTGGSGGWTLASSGNISISSSSAGQVVQAESTSSAWPSSATELLTMATVDGLYWGSIVFPVAFFRSRGGYVVVLNQVQEVSNAEITYIYNIFAEANPTSRLVTFKYRGVNRSALSAHSASYLVYAR